MTHALLFGATGLIGSHLLDFALAHDDLQVTAPTRRPLPRRHPRLANPVTDLSVLDPAQWPEHVDLAFCCLGTTLRQAGSREAFYAVDHDLVLRCARWARQLGARHFLAVSAIGASAGSRVFYNRVKGETERDLEALDFAGLTLLQPSLLLGERGGPARPGEALGIRLAPLWGSLMVGPLSAYTPVNAAHVARAMLQRARRPSGARVERLQYRDIEALQDLR